MDFLLGYLPMLYYLATIVVCSYLFYQVTEKEKISKIKKIIYWILIVVLAVGLYPIGALIGSFTVEGELIGSYFYHGSAGDLVITNSDVSMGTDAKGSESFRLESIDAKTGKIIGKTPTFAPENFLTQSDKKIWLYNSDDGIHAKTPDTLKVVVDQKTIYDKNPELKNGIVFSTIYVDPSTNQIVVTTKDGYNFEIDDNTYLVKPVTKSQLSAMKNIEGNSDSSSYDYKYYEITLSNKQKISIDDSSRSPIQKESGAKSSPLFPNSDVTFLSGSFLMDSTNGNHIELDSPSSILIIEKQAVDDSEPSLLSRVSLTGKIVWQQKLFDPSNDDYVTAVHMIGDTLVIVTNYQVLGLDPETGHIQWTTKF